MTDNHSLHLGWFATGTGTASPGLLRACLDAIDTGRLRAEIAVVFSNREPGEDPSSDGFHALVQKSGLTLATLSDRRFRREHGGEVARKGEPLPSWRRDYDREVISLLAPFDFKLGMLAGYKLIFGAEASERWDLLNLHPALPGGPKGVWQDVIWTLIEQRAERAGIMVHLATPELDEGPAVTYCSYGIRDAAMETLWATADRPVAEIKALEGEENSLFVEIRRRGVVREIPLVIETLCAVADGRVRVEDKRVVDGDGNPLPPMDLTAEIERTVRAMAS
jgi:folate-dependent phosphoribosylglycinamide formyltransferase PurN